MSDFEFDADKSVEENIEMFFESLEAADGNLTTILREEIGQLVPLPEGQQRTTVRAAFNAEVVKRLDSLDANGSPGES